MENPFEIIVEKLNSIERLLLEITNRNITDLTSTSSDELMNVKRVAEYLSLSVSTIYKLTFTMEIPCMKRGKRLYFRKDEINKWVAESRRKTRAEIEAEANDYILKRRRN